MTNKERINNMTDEQLARFLSEYNSLKFAPYIDVKAWLNSHEEDWIIKGSPGRITGCFSGNEFENKEVIVVEELADTMMNSVPYATVVEKRRNKIGEIKYNVYKVPREYLVFD